MFKYDKELSSGKLCELFIREGNFMSDGISIYSRDGPFYLRIPDRELPTELRKLLTIETRLELSPYKLDTIIELLKQAPQIRINTNVCNTGRILFRNGIYDVQDGKLHPHDEKYNWATVDANYIADAKLETAPIFLAFVKSSLEYPEKPEKLNLLLEVLGYILSDYICAKVAFFFIGEPSSGKSKVLEFLQRLLGDDAVSQISLAQIGSRFNLGQLRDKRLNVCTELPSNKFPSIDAFKAVTACDRIYGELKCKDGFSFYPKIKLLNAGNNVPFPSNTDGTRSLVERMTFLLFPKSIPREQWHVNLVEELLAEKNVICSLAVKKLKKLVEAKFEFAMPEDSRQFANDYRDALDAFNLFVKGACILQEEAQISSQQLWEAYQEFCSANTFPKGITQQIFVQKIGLVRGVEKKRMRENGRQITIFIGISLREGVDGWVDSGRTKKKQENQIIVAPKFKKSRQSLGNLKQPTQIYDQGGLI